MSALESVDETVLELLRHEGKMTSRRIMAVVFGPTLADGDRTVMALGRLMDAGLVEYDFSGFWATGRTTTAIDPPPACSCAKGRWDPWCVVHGKRKRPER